jgi:quercetin dioxygenase-like cupin family protein
MPEVFYMPLLGEGTKPGAYVYRVRAPNGFRIPPHWHTKTMHLTVLTGTLVLVMGESLDSSQARRYAPGSFLVMPAGMRHVEWFEGETVVHVETEGPMETVFVNPRRSFLLLVALCVHGIESSTAPSASAGSEPRYSGPTMGSSPRRV